MGELLWTNTLIGVKVTDKVKDKDGKNESKGKGKPEYTRKRNLKKLETK